MTSHKKLDSIEDQIHNVKASLPTPRLNLSEDEKDELVRKIGGPSTVRNVLNAAMNLPKARLFWLFNSLDPQLLVDILQNDMSDAIKRAKKIKSG